MHVFQHDNWSPSRQSLPYYWTGYTFFELKDNESNNFTSFYVTEYEEPERPVLSFVPPDTSCSKRDMGWSSSVYGDALDVGGNAVPPGNSVVMHSSSAPASIRTAKRSCFHTYI